MKIRQIHFLSGIVITLFVGLHLLNHVISVFGVSLHIEWMNNLRIVYQNFIVESVLLTALTIQIVSGIKLFLVKRKIASTFFEKLQIWTGLYLAFFLVAHVGTVLTARFVMHLDTNFYFGVAGLNTFPFVLFFIPYYALAIMSFFGHIAAIHYQKMKLSILGISPSQQSKLILIKGLLITVIIFYGLTNGFTGVDIPEAYNVMIGK